MKKLLYTYNFSLKLFTIIFLFDFSTFRLAGYSCLKNESNIIINNIEEIINSQCLTIVLTICNVRYFIELFNFT